MAQYMRKVVTSHTIDQRRHFSELAIGQRFYDPISAEFFVKQSDKTAVMVTGIGDGTVPDEFEPDDVVRIEGSV